MDSFFFFFGVIPLGDVLGGNKVLIRRDRWQDLGAQ